MPKKISSILHREWGSTYASAILMGSFTLFSQLLILSRDRLLAHYFGAGQTLDIFYAASRIPDILFVLFASLMTTLLFVPVFAKYATESEARAKKILNDIFSVIFTTFVLVTIGIMFATPFLVHYIFSGFDSAAQIKLVLTMRVLLVAPLFFSLSNLLGSVTQVLNRYVVFAIAPALYSFGIALGAILFYPAFGIIGLAMGAVVGSFLNFFVHFFISSRNGFIPTITWRPSYLDIWGLIRGSFPRTLYLAVTQISLIVLFGFAAKMEPGSVTIFALVLSMQAIPVTVIGTSFTTATFSGLSKHSVNEDLENFIERVVETTRYIIFWSVPALMLFVVLRAQFVRVILGSGYFDWTATRLASAGLAVLAASVVAQSLSQLFARVFHMAGNKAVPFVVNICSSIVMIVAAYGLVVGYTHSLSFQNFVGSFFRIDGVPGARVILLAVAFTLGAFINVFLFLYFFKKTFSNEIFSNVRVTFSESFFASIFAGFVTYEFLVILGLYLNLHTVLGIFSQGLVAFFAGVVAWWAVLEIINNQEIKEFREALNSKLWKAGIMLPGQEEI